MLKKILKIVGLLLVVVVVGLGGFVLFQLMRFESSMDHIYDVPPLKLAASTDPAVIARGEHLARSIGGCAIGDCHGTDLGGGKTLAMGPLGTLSGPNITVLAPAYSDGELARLIRHGIKKDGRSLRFMPAGEINWLPDSDVAALISFVRTVPVVPRGNGPLDIGLLGKVLDRLDLIDLDIARRIDHTAPLPPVPAPEPTAAYGQYIGRLCVGCHGKTFSGGPIPGAPPTLPIPPNITPHATGMASWTFADFEKLLDEGIRKNGKKLDPFMPLEALRNMDPIERRALWAWMQSLSPKEFGNR